jgi:MinD-like ATPase involved in chromosome partitioning or flagellar assembly
MAKVISIHSFRGGTGKSNTTANLATQIAMMGKRVGVVDTDIQSPGIHVLLGLEETRMTHSLNDYLWGKCSVKDTTYDVTQSIGPNISGNVFLIPSSIKAGEIAKILREGYDVNVLNDGFNELISNFKLDALLIDTHPGLNEETLLSVAISDSLLVILRPDQQDYQGTGVTVEVARKLGVPNLLLLINKLPASFSAEEVKKKVEQVYRCKVAAALPHSDEMMTLASSGVFSVKYPDHPISGVYRDLAELLMR